MSVVVRLLGAAVTLALASACVSSPAPSPPASAVPSSTASASSEAGSPKASPAPSLPADFPLGSWSNYLTEEDLRAAGYTDAPMIMENVGSSTLTLSADGTWTIAVESSQPMRWPVFRGTYAVSGPSTFRMWTTFPPDFAGEVVDLEWKYGDDGLHLRAIDPYDPIIHVQYETHPWQPKD
jgi:hypothetical protein